MQSTITGNMLPDYFTNMLIAIRAVERAIDASNDPNLGISKAVRVRPHDLPWHFIVECGIDPAYNREADVPHLLSTLERVIADSVMLDKALEDAIDASHHNTLATFE